MAVKLLCITPNAAIDRTLVVPRLITGAVQRPSELRQLAGGKGMNVARAARALGAQVSYVALLGGHNGHLFADLAAAEGLTGVWQWRDAETRICTSIVDQARGETTSLYEHGAALAAGEWQQFVHTATRAAAEAGAVCLSGSLPPGAPAAAPADLVIALRHAGKPVWVDTSGPALRLALAARPFGVKINCDEASELLGIDAQSAARQAAGRLLAAGTQVAVITLGAAGALLRCAAGAWLASPPPVTAINDVGNGDAFLAALALAYDRGRPPAEALRLAVAAGAANACSASVAGWTGNTLHQLAAATRVEPVVLARG